MYLVWCRYLAETNVTGVVFDESSIQYFHLFTLKQFSTSFFMIDDQFRRVDAITVNFYHRVETHDQSIYISQSLQLPLQQSMNPSRTAVISVNNLYDCLLSLNIPVRHSIARPRRAHTFPFLRG